MLLLGGAFLAFPAAVVAHGPVPSDPPTLANLLLGWQFDPIVASGLVLAGVGWVLVVARVGRMHPDHPVPMLRTAAFLGGLAAISFALLSGIGQYDTTLFSVHMVQHMLLLLVAGPLIALAAPVTQLLRAASPAWRRRILGVLHSGPIGALGNPVVAWVTFTLVVWLTHVSPLFDIALENQLAHEAEHVAYLGAGMLFWWPVVAADPSRARMTYPVRVMYLLLQMPPSSFLGMLITFAAAPLYPHYATMGRPYGIDALADQQLAGGIMWLAGDVVFIVAILVVVGAWMRHEERDTSAAERRVDAKRAALRERADQLERSRAAQAATQAPTQAAASQPGSGDSSSAR